MPTEVAVSVCGVIGVLLRYFLGHLTATCCPHSFMNVSSLFPNLIGCFMAGFATSQHMFTLPDVWKTGLVVGFLGGLTTFSAFSLETFRLFQDGRVVYATLHLISTPILGVVTLALGSFFARWITWRLFLLAEISEGLWSLWPRAGEETNTLKDAKSRGANLFSDLKWWLASPRLCLHLKKIWFRSGMLFKSQSIV